MDYREIAHLNQIDQSLITDWVSFGAIKLGWSKKTIRNYLTALSLFLDWCVSEKLIEQNPAKQIPRPRLNKTLPRNIPQEEVKRILDWTRVMDFGGPFQNSRAIAIISCFCYTGIRLNELINLRVFDINYEDRTLRIKHGKGGKERCIHLLPQINNDLQGYFQQRQYYGKESDYFFTGAVKDVKIGEKVVARIVDKIRKVSGVYFSPHMLRHSFASLLNENNVDLVTIQELMGHSDITTTRRYTHVNNEHIKRQMYSLPL